VNIPDIIGLGGSAILIAAYALVSGGRWASTQPRYQIINIIGTVMILYSLFFAWNLPSAVGQVIWIGLSVVGLIRQWRARRGGR
jgi:hypothetical protein